ncbi:MAG: MFS transporter [Desulfobacterales bacterium]|nr:MAG: MFS transporter [Desulfobacterales bacterium]
MAPTLKTRLRVFIPFALGYYLSYLYRVVNAVIAPDLISDLGIGPSELGLLTAAYFMTFAAAQLPLGVFLDRLGPRQSESFLLIFAGLGAFVFAQAETMTGLVAGRAFIGLGVSACLMASFKAFVLWFPSQQLPRINGFQMAAGGFGALTATAPVEALLGMTDWRSIFTGLAVTTLAVGAVLFWVVPERQPEEVQTGNRLREQLQGIIRVFSSATFWRIAPLTTMSQAAFLAIQGLWAGPWLRDVAQMARADAARALLWVAVAMICGFILWGTVAERLSRVGIKPIVVAVTGMTIFMAIQAFIILGLTTWTLALWVLFGFFGTTGIIPYAVLSQSFPAYLSGRVNTGVNLLVFLTAFAGQWGIGAVINRWPKSPGGAYAPPGYQAGFTMMLALQAMGLLWFIIAGIRAHR